MAVRPLNGLVSIARYRTRSGADTAVAELRAAGIAASVLPGPAPGVAPHLGASHSFSVLVRIGIADDANQVLVRSAAGPSSSSAASAVPSPAPAPPPAPPATGGDADAGDGAPLARPRWVKVVAWTAAGSLVLPPVLAAARAFAQL